MKNVSRVSIFKVLRSYNGCAQFNVVINRMCPYYVSCRFARVGVGMNRSVREGKKCFEWSNGLDTALYKNYLYLFLISAVVAG